MEIETTVGDGTVGNVGEGAENDRENVGNDGKSKGVEDIDDSSYMEDSDVLRSPYSSDTDSVVHSTSSDVTKRVQFNSIDLSNHVLLVGNTFHDAPKFRKAVRQYNILRGNDLVVKRNVCDCMQRHKEQVWTSNIRCWAITNFQTKQQPNYSLVSSKVFI